MAGSTEPSTFVCAACLEEEGLQAYARTHACQRACDYCESNPSDRSSIRVDAVIAFMRSKIEEEWCDPAENMSYDSSEGGYLGEVFDADELFYKLGLNFSNNAVRAEWRLDSAQNFT